MKALAALARGIDRVNRVVGRIAAWLILGTVLLCAATALLRYVVGIGFIWMQELYVVFFGTSFMLLGGYAYLTNEHVRVDILHAKMSPRRKAWIEIFGILVFVLPWLVIVAWVSRRFILDAWRIHEPSSTPGGLPTVYLFKTVIWVFCGLLGLQALAVLVRNVLILRGREDLV